MTRTVQLQVRLTEDERQQIHRASAEEQIRRGEPYTASELVRDAIREWIERRARSSRHPA